MNFNSHLNLHRLFAVFFLGMLNGFFNLGCSQVSDIDPRLYFKKKQVEELIKKDENDAAKRIILDLLKSEPSRPENHLNLGIVFEKTKEPEEALKSYRRAHKDALTHLQRFASLYNQAQNLGQQKKIDEALSYYQKALELNPTSKEVKVNIELLIQKQKQDQKQQEGDGQGGGESSQDQKEKDQKDEEKDKDKENEEQKPKNYKESPKYKPKKFEGKELSEYDVKQILGEIERQEQKMRTDYHRKKTKESARDKDW
ncbi:MAG TPA: tetratricopeptide repeat protein [Pseudobdellovibrionaceae bacterium]|nr:tetratricopeptide repeat protein [Pseudobdellovibrionaceae bacterium]